MLRIHINPVIGDVAISGVRPIHIDLVLTKIVDSGAPTVANDALRYLFRMFHFAVKREWVENNPVHGFDISDAGGTEAPRERWLSCEDLTTLAKDIRNGLRVLLVRDRAVEDWLRKDVAKAYDALKADPSRAVGVGAVKARLATAHKKASVKA